MRVWRDKIVGNHREDTARSIATVSQKEVSDYFNAQKEFADLYKDWYKENYPTMNDINHSEFVRNYVNNIALSLREYGRIQGYNLSLQFYQYLAWGGPTDWPKRNSNGNIMKDNYGNTIYEETPWFKTAFPTIPERKKVKNVILIEYTGKDMKGNSKIKKGDNASC